MQKDKIILGFLEKKKADENEVRKRMKNTDKSGVA
jgi:hypothetical protein